MGRFNKFILRSWIFKSSALLHVNAILCILFVLVQSQEGSLFHRSQFISSHENWMMMSWVSSILAIFSIVGTFSILTFILNHTYRMILYCAWFISIVGALIAFLNHFVQMTILPLLLEWLATKPSVRLMYHINEWESLLNQLNLLVIPTCFAISGLFYTFVMFDTQTFSRRLSWWSFSIWTALLMGVVFFQKYEQLYLLYAVLILFIYVPWLWNMGDSIKSDDDQVAGISCID